MMRCTRSSNSASAIKVDRTAHLQSLVLDQVRGLRNHSAASGLPRIRRGRRTAGSGDLEAQARCPTDRYRLAARCSSESATSRRICCTCRGNVDQLCAERPCSSFTCPDALWPVSTRPGASTVRTKSDFSTGRSPAAEFQNGSSRGINHIAKACMPQYGCPPSM